MAPCGLDSPLQSSFKPSNAVTAFLVANCPQSSLRHQEKSLSITQGTWLSIISLLNQGAASDGDSSGAA